MAETSSPFAALPEPPYFVVIFSSLRRHGDDGYAAMAEHMVELAARQPGYLGVESVRGADGFGVTNSFWKDEDSIRAWKRDVDHLHAQSQGRQRWYRRYAVRVARVERVYSFTADTGG
ncbi:antibiotic biosynthesis monooxygenase family protein [Rhizobium sp. TRM95796]|uniref:antibiotic biosynthesis monooxygenase family protein n=1 Tax=Rhizobium sp. TRM95796 TaxID=2979862 RepID=UPI0021E9423C|nr:antibiotic biosynthesis monooxygenase [Rhizobium sp. TRM95796]MCV3765329.1 antibiotic biosynthesis monooxygenase [Rhizobium sp. TRM95796]